MSKRLALRCVWCLGRVWSVQSRGCFRLFVTPWTAARQASLSITNSQSLLRLTSMESVMPSNHLILCHPHLLPLIFLSIRVFSKESVLPIRWPEYWSFSFSISPPNEYSGLIFFRIDWFDHQCLIKVSVNIDVVISMGFSGGSVVKNPPANAEDAEMQVPSLDWEDPSGEGNGNPLSILA